MHIYPHIELALLPQVLIPLLPKHCVILGDGTCIDADQLADAAFCRSLSDQDRQNAAACINTMMHRLCYGRQKKGDWASRRFQVPQGIHLSDLKLTNRVLVSLQCHPLFSADGAWRTTTPNEIMGAPASRPVGARLMLALLLAVEDARISKDTPLAPIGNLCDELRDRVGGIIYAVRTAHIYLTINGWSGMGPGRLKDVAARHGLTHERTRQIYVAGQQLMQRSCVNNKPMPYLSAAAAEMERRAPFLIGHDTAYLDPSNAVNERFSVRDLICACGKFGVPIGVSIHLINDQSFLLLPGQAAFIIAARSLVRKLLRSEGVLNVVILKEKLLALLPESILSIDSPSFSSLFEASIVSMKGWSYLDYECQWATVTIGTAGERLNPRGLVTRIAKMAAYFNGIDLWVACQDLSRQSIDFPPQVILGICRRSGLDIQPGPADWRISVGRHLHQSINKNLVDSVEYEMANILVDARKSLSPKAFLTHCCAAGVTRATALVKMKSSCLFFLNGDGDYQLCSTAHAGGCNSNFTSRKEMQ